MTAVIGIHDAKTRFSQLVKQVAAGESVLIGGYGKAEVALVAVDKARTKKRVGVLAGKLVLPDDLDAPLPEDVLQAFEGDI